MSSASLGSLVIELAANTARLASDLGRAATIAEKQAKRMTRMFRGAAGLVGGFSIVLLGKKFFDNMDEAQRASGQLAAALKSTGGAVGLTVGQLNNLATSLQKTTTFSDEAVKGVESILLAFTNLHGEQFKAATSAVTDLSTRLGIDLTSAAKLVGKALNDPVNGLGALRKAGISFTKSEEEVIKALVKTGDVAGAQDKILAALTTRFGGAAAAARNTIGGALIGLKNAFGDLFEGTDDQLLRVTAGINTFSKQLGDPAIRSAINTSIGFLIESLAEAAKIIAGVINGWKLLWEIVSKPFKTDSLHDAAAKRSSEIGAAINNELDHQTLRKKLLPNNPIDQASRDRLVQLRKDFDKAQAEFRGSKPFAGLTRDANEMAAAAKNAADKVNALASDLSEVQLDEVGPPKILHPLSDEFLAQQQELTARFEEGKITLDEYVQAIDDAKSKMDPLGDALKKLKDREQENNAVLQEGQAIYESTRTTAENYAATLAHLNELLKAGAFGEGAAAVDTYNRAVKQLTDQQSGLTDKMAEGKSIIAATRTESEQYAATVAKLNDLLSAGAFGVGAEAIDTYQRAMQEAQTHLDTFINTLREGLKSAFDDMLRTGKFSFRSLAQFIVAELAKKEIFKAIDNIADALFKAFHPSGDGGGSGLLGSIIGAIGGIFGGGSGGGGGSGRLVRAASGADFVVGGRSGKDANLVPMALTKGERVQVTPAGRWGGDAPAIIVNQTVNVYPGDTDLEKAMPRILNETRRAAVEDSLKAVAQSSRRGRYQ